MDVGGMIEPDLSNVPDGWRIRLRAQPPSTDEKRRYGIEVVLQERRVAHKRKFPTYKKVEDVYWVSSGDEVVYLQDWDEVAAVGKIEGAVEALVKRWIPEVPDYDQAKDFIKQLNTEHQSDPKRAGRTYQYYNYF